MSLLSIILIGLVALLHLCFLWLEMFAWETTGRKVFRSLPAELFPATKVLAANQGLYNGFLAAGLIWSLTISDTQWAERIAIFFLLCVIIAAIYGAVTASRKIIYVQGIPAILALASIFVI